MSSNAYNANFLFHGVYADTRVYLIGKKFYGCYFSFHLNRKDIKKKVTSTYKTHDDKKKQTKSF